MDQSDLSHCTSAILIVGVGNSRVECRHTDIDMQIGAILVTYYVLKRSNAAVTSSPLPSASPGVHY